MKRVERDEVLPMGAYESIRDRFRSRVIAEKRTRRVKLGPKASAVFENHDTVLLQIQEMLRTERISKASSVQHEIDTYNQLIPGDDEVSATVMIEIDEKEEREAFLVGARGIERSIALDVDGERFGASWEKDRELEDRASAVMYLKFRMNDRACGALRGARAAAELPKVALVVDHALYAARAELSREAILSLSEDFE